MIARGEVLERMTLVRAGGLELEALFQDGASSVPQREPVVLAGPHPRLGGNMDAPVLAELVWVLARAGHPTLRFNWRGVGASQGQTRVPPLPADSPPALDDECADLWAALDQQVAQLGSRTAVLVGYSFGAAVAVRVAASHPAVQRAVFIAPPLSVLPFPTEPLLHSGVHATFIAAAEDSHASETARTQAGVPWQVVPGATHTFLRGLSQLGEWVRESLPGTGP